MEFEHKKFGKCAIAEITQKQVENFHGAMKGKEGEPLSLWRGESVRNALKFGIIIEPEWSVEQVDEARPGQVVWLSECVAKAFVEALSIDPLS
jgi:hypothetical protein